MKDTQTFPPNHKPTYLEKSLAQMTGYEYKTYNKQPSGRQFQEQPESTLSS